MTSLTHPFHGNLASFVAKHVTDKVTATIAPKSDADPGDMNTPTIQMTETHVGLLMPKKWVWPFLASVSVGVGGITIVQYLGNKAGFATKDEVAATKVEITNTIKQAVAESQAATQQSLNTLIEDAVRKSVEAAVRPAVEQAVKPIDDRVARMERAAKAKEKTNAP